MSCLTPRSRSLLIVPAVVLLMLMFAASTDAQTTSFTYQGRLQESGSNANGNYDFQFTLWDALSGGMQQPQPTPVTVTRMNVAVANGTFTVQLDFGAAAFPGADRFLEISVRQAGSGSFTQLLPRQPITSTPYAIRSITASSVAATNITGTLSVANGGTGLATLPSDGLLVGAGASNPTSLAPGTKGNVVKSTGSAWASAAYRSNEFDVENYASFEAAVAAIGSNVATLYIPSTQNVSNNTTIPSTLTLQFTGQGALNVTTGRTVTIQSDGSQWPRRNIFINALAGQGTVSFAGNNAQKDFWVDWWGAKGDGVTDNTAAITAAQAAIPDGRTLHFAFGTYNHTGITFDHHAHITIIGSDGEYGYADAGWTPRIVYTGPAGGTAITFMNMYACTLRGIRSDAGEADINLFITQTAGGSPGLTSQDVIEYNTFIGNTHAGYFGIKIDNASMQNNEQHVIYKNLIQGGYQSVPNNTGVGVYLGHANVKEIKITGNTFLGLNYGIQGAGNPSMYSIQNNFSDSNYWHYGAFGDVNEISDCYAEGGLSVLFTPAGFDFRGSIRHIRFDNIDVNSGASVTIPVIQAQGAFSVEDSQFLTGNSNFGNKLIYNPSPGTSELLWLRNRIPTMTPANLRAAIDTYVASVDDGLGGDNIWTFRSNNNISPGGLAAISLASNTASNTDLNGELTIGGGGTVTYAFANLQYTTKPVCTLTQQSAPVTVPWYTATTTALTVHGDVGAVISYHCVGRK